jgi:hypothetical protein
MIIMFSAPREKAGSTKLRCAPGRPRWCFVLASLPDAVQLWATSIVESAHKSMRCFYHQDREAIGACKSCNKGLCAECAVDLGNGLACRGRCEADVQAVIRLVDQNSKQTPKQRQERPAKVLVGTLVGTAGFYLCDCLVAHPAHLDVPWIQSGVYCGGVFGFLATVCLFIGGMIFVFTCRAEERCQDQERDQP